MRQSKSLTVKGIQNYNPPKLPYKLADGDGLYLCFLESGAKVWRFRLRTPKDTWRLIGPYPAVSLAEARKAKQEIKSKVLRGEDVPTARQNVYTMRQQYNFCDIAQEWINSDKPHASPKTTEKRLGLLQNYLNGSIGKKDIRELKRAELLEALKAPLSGAEKYYTVPRRLAQFVRKVYDYARLKEFVPSSHFPDAHLTDLLPKEPPVKHHACLTDPRDISRLLQGIVTWEIRCQQIQVAFALQMMPYVFLRVSELVGGLWSEVDFSKGLWTISAQRMKTTRPHIIPLSKQVVCLLERAKEYAKDSAYIFPSSRSKTGHICGVALLDALKTLGWDTDDEMSLHGFRGMFSTLANEAGYRSEVIELQMAHVDKNAVRAAYNHATYMPERKTMLQNWADYLDALRDGKIESMTDWLQARNAQSTARNSL